MRKALIVVVLIVVAIALAVWVASWFRAEEAVAISAARPWPGGMGPLDSIADQPPAPQANEASVRLRALANGLPRSEAVDEFVGRQIARGELTIEEPPALPDVSPLRELLLREPIVWERHQGIGSTESTERRALQMTAARALVASALAKGRGSDPVAWDDLQAVWRLARSLDGDPQVMSQTAALSMMRMVNAIAWKLPLPAPEWFGELQSHDHVMPLLEAFHHQSASYWQSGATLFPTTFLAASVEHDRLIAEELFRNEGCEVDVPMNKLGVDLRSVWQRAFRYRAEREATSNALRVRDGRELETASRCNDAEWSFDGTTVRFSREIPTGAPDRPMPLVLRLEN
jgi:hypothetical protein